MSSTIVDFDPLYRMRFPYCGRLRQRQEAIGRLTLPAPRVRKDSLPVCQTGSKPALARRFGYENKPVLLRHLRHKRHVGRISG